MSRQSAGSLVVGVVSTVLQLLGCLLAVGVVVVTSSSSGDLDQTRLFVALLVSFTGVSFLASYVARRRVGRDSAVGPLASLAGPLAFVVVTVAFSASTVGLGYLLPQVVLPLLAGAAGHTAAVRAHAAPVRRAPRRRVAGDVGAVSVEYLAVSAAMIALIGGALLGGGLGRYVQYAFENLWCKVSGGPCDLVSPRDEDFAPPSCLTSESTFEVDLEGKVLFITVGDTLQLITSENSDGTVSIAIAGEDEVGAEAKAGIEGKLQFGDLDLSPSLEASAGASGTVKTAERYDFPDRETADRFVNEVRLRYGADLAAKVNVPGAAVFAWAREAVSGGGLPPPTVRTQSGGGRVFAGVDAGAPVLGGVELGGEAATLLGYSTIDVGGGRFDTETSVEVSLQGTAGANIFGAGVGGTKTGTGVVTIRRDPDGRPVNVTWTGTTVGEFEGLFGQPPDLNDALDLQKLFSASVSGGGEDQVVVTTSLDLDTPARRALFEDWNSGLGVERPLSDASGAAWGALFGGEPARGSEDFQALIADQGKTSIVEYEGDGFGVGLGLELNVLGGVGAGVGGGTKSLTATGAQYLGAPDADGVRELVPFPGCVD